TRKNAPLGALSFQLLAPQTLVVSERKVWVTDGFRHRALASAHWCDRFRRLRGGFLGFGFLCFQGLRRELRFEPSDLPSRSEGRELTDAQSLVRIFRQLIEECGSVLRRDDRFRHRRRRRDVIQRGNHLVKVWILFRKG